MGHIGVIFGSCLGSLWDRSGINSTYFKDVATGVATPSTYQQRMKNIEFVIDPNSLIVTIEAGSINCWQKYLKEKDIALGINKFGKSAPYKEIFEDMNLTSNKIVTVIQERLRNK